MVFFAVRDLPPSAQRVLEILVANGALTHKELVAATRLPPRTVRFALARLRTSGRVIWRWSLRDARQRLYAIPRGDGHGGEVASRMRYGYSLLPP